MRRLTTVAGAAMAVMAMSLGVVGCGSDGKTTTSSSSSATKTTTSTATSSKPTTSTAPASGANYTIADYIKDNQIQETAIHHGDAGAPTIDLPIPDGWTQVPESDNAPYGGIVYHQATDPQDPPTIVALVSKLSGNVDPAKVLEYAPGELKNLPGYQPLGNGGTAGTLGGFQAYQLGGNYTKAGQKRVIAQKTVVIPAQTGLFVLQLNADAPAAELDQTMAAANVIDDQTTITP
ncbi:LpqN/LpqT family lipoprotein [Mycobacterium sp. MMS18-G62]